MVQVGHLVASGNCNCKYNKYENLSDFPVEAQEKVSADYPS